MNTQLLDCGHQPSPHESFTTGYGVDNDGKKYCYDCCAERDREAMRKDGRIMLYLTKEHTGPHTWTWKISNWPGSLVFHTGIVSRSRHNWGLTRRDFWFRFENQCWHGFQIGENTQIAHCKRVKKMPWQ
jgi:hypothetical protein